MTLIKYSQLQDSKNEKAVQAFFRLDDFCCSNFSHSQVEDLQEERLREEEWIEISKLGDKSLEIEILLILEVIKGQQKDAFEHECNQRKYLESVWL